MVSQYLLAYALERGYGGLNNIKFVLLKNIEKKYMECYNHNGRK